MLPPRLRCSSTIQYQRNINKILKVERLIQLGFIEIANDLEWGPTSLSRPKHKSNQVRFLNKFRYLNKQLKCRPYLIPMMNGILLKLEGF